MSLITIKPLQEGLLRKMAVVLSSIDYGAPSFNPMASTTIHIFVSAIFDDRYSVFFGFFNCLPN